MQGQQSGKSPADGVLADLKFHHVGCAVRDIEKAVEFYCGTLGCKRLTAPVPVPSQNVKVCFLQLGPGALLELVEGVEGASPVDQLIEKTGGGPYHLCFQVADLDVAVKALRKRRCFPLTRFEQHVEGLSRFAFLLTPDRHLFELCETERSGS
jgi:methylmalonyl-CoA/ethylmalonyl-CoA epimerase